MKIRYLTALLTALAFVAMRAMGDAPPERITPQPVGVAPYSRAALDAYGEGYAILERAARLEEDAHEGSGRRDALIADARLAYKDALHHFEIGVAADPRMYEAHTYIGYVLRKLERHAAALAAYQTALDLKPDYVRAIEYQGEAYLGLNRFEDAKRNYLRLYALDAEQADKLLSAMHDWASQKETHEHQAQRANARAWLKTRPRPQSAAHRLAHW